jgi:predicted Zn finger-like uncharacterized protein
MPQITQCPHCRGQLQVRDENLGQTIRCPLCNGLFKVAAPQAPPPVVNVEVIETLAPPPPPPPPAAPPKPKPSSAARKPAPKPAQKTKPTPASPPAGPQRPRRPKPPAEAPAPPAPAAEESPFALGGLGGSPATGPAALNFEEGPPKPHRGTTVLVLGLLGWFFSCCPLVGFILGGSALTMGNRDLRLMARNRMDRAGKGLTQAGKILGIVGLVFSTLCLIVWVWQLTVLVMRLGS